MRRALLWSVMAMLLLMVAVQAQDKMGGGTEKAVAALEQQWLQSQKTNNPDLVAPLLADKFTNTGPDGKVSGKTAMLATAKETKYALLSGIFRYAKRHGVINSENPIRDVVLPKGKPAGETYAYSLAEINQMLNVLPEPAATIVAVAAFTGVRKSELRGFVWENYDGEHVLISQSYWRGHALEPKTRQSRAPVPIIAQLAERLECHRTLMGSPAKGLIFFSRAGNPVNLDALTGRVIVPLLTNANVSWHGWHAFRRGLATNLHQLSVADKTIQRILRHANVAVTQACYIKTADSEVAAAMQQFERSLEYAPDMHLSGAQR